MSTAAATVLAFPSRPRFGARYVETKGMTATQIARRVRLDIKAAVAQGELPVARYSVRTRYASMMQAIDVEVADVPVCCWDTESDAVVFTSAGRVVSERVAGILAAYNREDDKHPRFFAHVSVEPGERDAMFVALDAFRS